MQRNQFESGIPFLKANKNFFQFFHSMILCATIALPGLFWMKLGFFQPFVQNWAIFSQLRIYQPFSTPPTAYVNKMPSFQGFQLWLFDYTLHSTDC